MAFCVYLSCRNDEKEKKKKKKTRKITYNRAYDISVPSYNVLLCVATTIADAAERIYMKYDTFITCEFL